MTNSNADDRQREHGIDFGEFGEALQSMDYPVDCDAVVAEWGDHELDLPKGSERVGDALGPLGDESFESPEELRRAVLTMVDADAVGREDYSDRGDTTEQATDSDDQQSL